MKGMTNYFQGAGAGCLNNRRGGVEGWGGAGGGGGTLADNLHA